MNRTIARAVLCILLGALFDPGAIRAQTAPPMPTGDPRRGGQTAPPIPTAPGRRGTTPVPSAAAPIVAATPMPMHFKVTAEDGKVIEGAKLSLTDSTSIIIPAGSRLWHEDVTTDAGGEASATYVPTTPQTGLRPILIVATAPGYAPFFMRGVEPYKQPVFPLVLRPGQTITGIIKNDRGEPLADVKVKATRSESALRQSDVFNLSAATGADGRFEFTHVPDAKFTLSTEIPAKDGAWMASATDLLVGALPAAPIEIVAHPGIVIKGQIIAPPEVDLNKLQQFWLNLREPTNTTMALLPSSDGRFEAGGIPAGAKGQVYLYLPNTAGGYWANATWENAPAGVTPSTGTTGVDFANLPPGIYEGMKIEFVKLAKVTGTISDPIGSPLENISVRVTSTRGGYIGYSKPDGTYEVIAPPRGGYHVEVGSVTGRGGVAGRGGAIPGAAPPPQVEAQSLPEEFALAPDQTLEKNITARIILRPPHNGVIMGQIVGGDGQPVIGATVYLSNQAMIPTDLTAIEREGERPTWTGGTTGPATTKMTPEGFSFNTLIDGTTDLWAFDASGGWGMARDLKPGAFGVEIKLTPQSDPLQIAGQVVAAGKPVADARVIIQTGNGAISTLGDAKSDAEGKFKLEVSSRQQAAAFLRVLCIPPTGAITWKNIPPMATDNMKIELKPEVPLIGRVLDNVGKPISGAKLTVSSIRDTSLGMASFPQQGAPARGRRGVAADTVSLGPLTPAATTDAQGQYAIHGLSANATAIVMATAPNYSSSSYSSSNSGGNPQPLDITLQAYGTMEGTVRSGGSGQPVAGAKVAFLVSTRELQTTTSDDKGHFRLTGLQNYYRPTIEAQSGTGAEQLIGRTIFTNQLIGGETATGVDIVMEPGLAARQAAWIAKPAQNSAPTPPIAILDDMTPASQAGVQGTINLSTDLQARDLALQEQIALARAQAAAQGGAILQPNPLGSELTARSAARGTLTLYDPQHNQRWQYSGLNLMRANIRGPIIALDPKDQGIWICEPPGRILRIKADGTLDWEKNNFRAQSIALDTQSSNVWVLASPGANVSQAGGLQGTVSTAATTETHVVVIDARGNVVKEFSLSGSASPSPVYQLVDSNGVLTRTTADGGSTLNIAYSPHDQSFWTAGTIIRKIDLDGGTLVQSPISFNSSSRGIAVDSSDGSAWIIGGDAPSDPGSPQRILRLTSSARPEREFPLDASALLVDSRRENLWSINAQGELIRSNLEGASPQRIPVLPNSLALEPDTGYVWAAARDGVYRIDPQGNYVWHMPSKEPTTKWVLVLPVP